MCTIVKRVLLLALLLLKLWRVRSQCDQSTTAVLQQGNHKQTGRFPWLGILTVQLRGFDNPVPAVTGLVLIARAHALVNAQDVEKIPLNIFTENAYVVFIGNSSAEYGRAESFIVHPEYKEITYNTIAVLLIEVTHAKGYAIIPICWRDTTKASLLQLGSLYAAGFTDENSVFEKVIYRMKLIHEKTCKQFYKKIGLSDITQQPTHLTCGFAPLFKTRCVWDNGMVLISKATTYFTLIGFGVRGPGCASPARFIDLRPYHAWIEQIIAQNARRVAIAAFDTESKDNIPLHVGTFSTEEDDIRRYPAVKKYLYRKYGNTRRYFFLRQNGGTAVVSEGESMEDVKTSCEIESHSILYHEISRVIQMGAGTNAGNATYKISLYDMLRTKCTCMEVSIRSSWKTAVNFTIKVDEFDIQLDSQQDPGDFLYKLIYGFSFLPTYFNTSLNRGFVTTYSLNVDFEVEVDYTFLEVVLYTDKTYNILRSKEPKSIPEEIRRSFEGTSHNKFYTVPVISTQHESIDGTLMMTPHIFPVEQFISSSEASLREHSKNSSTTSSNPMAFGGDSTTFPVDVNIEEHFSVDDVDDEVRPMISDIYGKDADRSLGNSEVDDKAINFIKGKNASNSTAPYDDSSHSHTSDLELDDMYLDSFVIPIDRYDPDDPDNNSAVRFRNVLKFNSDFINVVCLVKIVILIM